MELKVFFGSGCVGMGREDPGRELSREGRVGWGCPRRKEESQGIQRVRKGRAAREVVMKN